MKLSEAIRVGAMLGPQGFGRLKQARRRFLGLFGRSTTEYCALGGAFAAGGFSSHREPSDGREGFRGTAAAPGEMVTVIETPNEWNVFFETVRPCPQCRRPLLGKRLLPHLNDDHRWTREEIARFVESCEWVPSLAGLVSGLGWHRPQLQWQQPAQPETAQQDANILRSIGIAP